MQNVYPLSLPVLVSFYYDEEGRLEVHWGRGMDEKREANRKEEKKSV